MNKQQLIEDIKNYLIFTVLVVVAIFVALIITEGVCALFDKVSGNENDMPDIKIKKIATSTSKAQESPITYEYKGEYELTWYCTGSKTASGNKVNHQLTGAVDLRHFNFNDVLYIEYLDKPIVAHDTGGAVKGNIIDIYTNDCEEAIKNGRKKSKVYLIGSRG